MCRSLNVEYRTKMDELHEFILEYSKKLNRSIKDLDDVRAAMASLEVIKTEFTRMDFSLGGFGVGRLASMIGAAGQGRCRDLDKVLKILLPV